MATAPQKTTVQILDDQKRRLASLQERRTRVQVKLENERKALADARAEALKLFGTSDLAELRALYQTRQGDNDQKVMDFMLSLDSVEEQLGTIERQINF